MASQNEVKICPLCDTQNAADAETCQGCGAPLRLTGITTIYLDEKRQTGDLGKSAVPNTEAIIESLPEGALALLVLGQAMPLIIKDEPVISLGRRVQGEPPPVVDFVEYHAHLLGVSRRHAVIRRMATGYVIEDLNSNNGTWVNETRISPNQAHPLASGDSLRLGQLVLRVYFP